MWLMQPWILFKSVCDIHKPWIHFVYKNIYELLDSIILFDQLLSLIISNLCVYELNYLEKMFYCCFLPRAHIFFLRLRDFLAFCFKGLMRGWIFLLYYKVYGIFSSWWIFRWLLLIFKRDDFFSCMNIQLNNK